MDHDGQDASIGAPSERVVAFTTVAASAHAHTRALRDVTADAHRLAAELGVAALQRELARSAARDIRRLAAVVAESASGVDRAMRSAPARAGSAPPIDAVRACADSAALLCLRVETLSSALDCYEAADDEAAAAAEDVSSALGAESAVAAREEASVVSLCDLAIQLRAAIAATPS